MIENEFDNDTKYRLFRTVREILHPSISKRNISDYKIIMTDDTLPIRVFYPKKVSELHKIIIFIHGNGNITSCHGIYSDICKELSKKLDKLVIGIEYDEEDLKYEDRLKKLEATISYLYDGLEKNNKSDEDVIIMGDSTGCGLIEDINKKDISSKIKKEVFCYPILSKDFLDKKKYPSIEKNMEFNPTLSLKIEEFYKNNKVKEDRKKKKNKIKTLILIGSIDPLLDGVKGYYQEQDSEYSRLITLPFANHGFLKNMDQELEEEFYKEMNDFIG